MQSASVDAYGFGEALAPGATWIQPRWYAYEWDTPFAEVCRLAPRLVSAFMEKKSVTRERFSESPPISGSRMTQ
ncbi:MAG TPA: hypothetical protein VF546_13330 [Pyrinomonadaceae bacterium]